MATGIIQVETNVFIYHKYLQQFYTYIYVIEAFTHFNAPSMMPIFQKHNYKRNLNLLPACAHTTKMHEMVAHNL